MENEKRRSDKKHLRLVDKYDNDDYSRYAGPDFIEETFELGEQDFEHSPHDTSNINIRQKGTWTNPGVSGKSDDGETWVNEEEYQEQIDFTGFGPKDYRRSDDRIYEEVCETLMRHREVDASNIGVKVDRGIVNLSGKVSSRRMKKIAELIIEDLPGVRDIKNELSVFISDTNPKGPDKATKKDLGIT